MSRLTTKINNTATLEKTRLLSCHTICEDRAKTEKTGCKGCAIQEAIDRLAHYEDLEEAGRLIELPCKVGDYVYKLTTKCDQHKCPPISCEQCDFDEQFVGIRKFKFSYECMYLLEKYLGDTVFLTKSEAEAKLAELKGGAE